MKILAAIVVVGIIAVAIKAKPKDREFHKVKEVKLSEYFVRKDNDQGKW